jgi:hypothetical protein
VGFGFASAVSCTVICGSALDGAAGSVADDGGGASALCSACAFGGVGSAASASDGACGGGGAAVVPVDGVRPRRWHCSPGRWYGFDGEGWMAIFINLSGFFSPG